VQLATVKALEIIEKSHINDKISRTARVHTDSRIILQSLKNTKNHNYLTGNTHKSRSASTETALSTSRYVQHVTNSAN
jgi:hypothetical protein